MGHHASTTDCQFILVCYTWLMHLFIIPLAVAIIAQIIKLGLEVYNGTFAWSHVNSYGGMPSTHAALVTSLSTTLYYFEGIASPAFAISLVLLVVTARDAMGYRRQLGVHAQIVNKLVKELPDRREYQFPFLTEKLGHGFLEVLVGFLVGVLGTVVILALAA